MDTSVVIVGAGPVGLAFAVGLAHHGIECVVLEQDASLSRHSKAPGVMARTLEIFHSWGIDEAFIDHGSFLSQPELWVVGEASSRVAIDFFPLKASTRFPGVLLIPQDRTEAILFDRARASGLCDIRFGHRAVEIEDRAGPVTVRVDTGKRRYSLRTPHVVGCDGAHSTVRKHLGWELEGRTYPTRLMLADVRLPDRRNELPWPRVAPRGRGILASARIEQDLWRIISTVAAHVHDDDAISRDTVARHVLDLFGPGEFELVWSDVFRIHCRTSPGFRRGGVFIAGDAAHINSPAGGQGMNSGIHDAHNLAWKLARVLRGTPAEPLLSSYEAERRPAILTNVDRYTDLLTRGFLLASPLIRRAVLQVVKAVLRTPPLLRHVLRRAAMLDTRYRDSPVISGTGRLVGARAPDAPLEDGTGRGHRLLDVAQREAALLLFDDGNRPSWNADETAGLIAAVPEVAVYRIVRNRAAAGPCDLVDDSGELWQRWEPSHGSAALVRPDHYVGWMHFRPTPAELRCGVARALGSQAQEL